MVSLLLILSPINLVKLICCRKERDLSDEDKARLKRLSFNDFDETSLLMNSQETPDGYTYETVHDVPEEVQGPLDTEVESELEAVDEGAVMALSMDEIRKMRGFVKPVDTQNLELSETWSRLEQESFELPAEISSKSRRSITPTEKDAKTNLMLKLQSCENRSFEDS